MGFIICPGGKKKKKKSLKRLQRSRITYKKNKMRAYGGHMDEAGAVFISVPPAAMPTPHLGEVPALDEVSGNITGRFAVHHG